MRADEVDGRDAAAAAARRRRPAGDRRARDHGLDRERGGVEEPRDVGHGRRRDQPATLVRLVPDDPAAHPRVPLRRGARERRERGAPVRGATLGPPPPFAQAGVPQIATTGTIPAPRSASRSASVCSRRTSLRDGCTARQSIVTRATSTPIAGAAPPARRSSPGPKASQASSATPTRRLGEAVCGRRPSARTASDRGCRREERRGAPRRGLPRCAAPEPVLQSFLTS